MRFTIGAMPGPSLLPAPSPAGISHHGIGRSDNVRRGAAKYVDCSGWLGRNENPERICRVGCEAAFCMSDMDGKLVCENSFSSFFFSPRKRLALSLTLPAPAAEMR